MLFINLLPGFMQVGVVMHDCASRDTPIVNICMNKECS